MRSITVISGHFYYEITYVQSVPYRPGYHEKRLHNCLLLLQQGLNRPGRVDYTGNALTS